MLGCVFCTKRPVHGGGKQGLTVVNRIQGKVVYKTSIPKTRAPEICEPPNPTKIRLHVELDENDDMTIRLMSRMSWSAIC